MEEKTLNKGYVCDGCEKLFDFNELFWDGGIQGWVCDSCLKKGEGVKGVK